MNFELNGTSYPVIDYRLPEYDEDGVSTYWETRNQEKHAVKYLICHCMDAKTEQEVTSIFHHYKVSAHYVVTPDGEILCYVDPEQVAYHAGQSAFDDFDSTPVYVKLPSRPRTLNYTSVGIEFLCPGYAYGGKHWYHFEPFTDKQRDVGVALIQYLCQRFQIPRDNILAHSDIAPYRRNPSNPDEIVFAKSDPGAKFFWRDLVAVGLSMPLPDRLSNNRPTISWIQETLKQIGYCLTPLSGKLDIETIYVIIAFQLHFVPEKFVNESYVEIALSEKNYDWMIDDRTVGALEDLRVYKSSNKQS